MNYIRKRFVEIEDSRHSGYVEQNLVDLLITVMYVVMC